MIAVELSVRSDRETTGLSGSGVIIVNPPFTLEGELAVLLPFLKERLAQDRFAGTRLVRLAGETG